LSALSLGSVDFAGGAKDLEILTGTAENMIRIAMLEKTLANCG
jgi:hypothetical protein